MIFQINYWLGVDSKLEKEAQDAIKQIIDKKYDAKLIEKGIKDIKYVAIAFSGKEIKVKRKKTESLLRRNSLFSNYFCFL